MKKVTAFFKSLCKCALIVLVLFFVGATVYKQIFTGDNLANALKVAAVISIGFSLYMAMQEE